MSIYKIITTISIIILLSGCTEEKVEDKKEIEENTKAYAELINYKDALEIFEEGKVAKITDVETGISFEVRRIEGGFDTIADVETLTKEDTEKLLETSGGNWSIIRRAAIVEIDGYVIAASIAPFEHSGDENFEYGQIIDNRSGATGSGINLDSIKDNGMIGVVDIYFHNSLIPGIARVDERHQEMVLKANEYEI